MLLDSPVSCPPCLTKRGVYAVRLSVDELPAHAGDQRAEYDSDVGYVLGELDYLSFLVLLHEPLAVRRAGRVLAIPPIRVLGFLGQVEREAAADGLSGAFASSSLIYWSSNPLRIFLRFLVHHLTPLTGHHHVPAVAPDAGLDGP